MKCNVNCVCEWKRTYGKLKIGVFRKNELCVLRTFDHKVNVENESFKEYLVILCVND